MGLKYTGVVGYNNLPTSEAFDMALAFYSAAISSAPTYFRPHVTNLPDGRTFIDVDGALFANHPVFVGARTLRDA